MTELKRKLIGVASNTGTQPSIQWTGGCYRVAVIVLWLLLGVMWTGLVPRAAAAAPVNPVIHQIDWRSFGLHVSADAALAPDISWLSKPTRFVLDLPTATLENPRLARTIAVNDPVIQRIRIARTPTGGIRVVVDCQDVVPFQVISLRSKQDLVVSASHQNRQELAALINQPETPPPPKVIHGISARETGEEAELSFDGLKHLRPVLAQVDATHLDIHLQGEMFKDALPAPDSIFQRFERVAKPRGGWTLKVTLAPGVYNLDQRIESQQQRMVLIWTKENPRRFAGAPLILIDPGHGGSDPGAIGPQGRSEKDVCLGIAKMLKFSLLQRGINAVLTRSTDAEMLLEPRLRMIDTIGADAFVSLHVNSHTTSAASGFETFYREPPSQKFAELVHNHAAARFKHQNRGVKQEQLYVLRHTRVPSILLETGFISNPDEANKLIDPSFQNQMATAIASGLEDFFTTNQIATIGQNSLEN